MRDGKLAQVRGGRDGSKDVAENDSAELALLVEDRENVLPGGSRRLLNDFACGRARRQSRVGAIANDYVGDAHASQNIEDEIFAMGRRIALRANLRLIQTAPPERNQGDPFAEPERPH